MVKVKKGYKELRSLSWNRQPEEESKYREPNSVSMDCSVGKKTSLGSWK